MDFCAWRRPPENTQQKPTEASATLIIRWHSALSMCCAFANPRPESNNFHCQTSSTSLVSLPFRWLTLPRNHPNPSWIRGSEEVLLFPMIVPCVLPFWLQPNTLGNFSRNWARPTTDLVSFRVSGLGYSKDCGWFRVSFGDRPTWFCQPVPISNPNFWTSEICKEQ